MLGAGVVVGGVANRKGVEYEASNGVTIPEEREMSCNTFNAKAEKRQ